MSVPCVRVDRASFAAGVFAPLDETRLDQTRNDFKQPRIALLPIAHGCGRPPGNVWKVFLSSPCGLTVADRVMMCSAMTATELVTPVLVERLSG